MTHDWMNDPELDQLPTSPKQNLDGLKQLAARESSANDLPAPAVPSHYAMSMAELKAQRAATLPTSHPVQPAPAQPAQPAKPATITSTALIELSTLVGIAQSSESPEALLPECCRGYPA
jgi:hypothetical protein